MPGRIKLAALFACAICLSGLAVAVPAGAVTISTGDIVVVDAEEDPGDGSLIKVDGTTGQQTLISDNTLSDSDRSFFRKPSTSLVTASSWSSMSAPRRSSPWIQ